MNTSKITIIVLLCFHLICFGDSPLDSLSKEELAQVTQKGFVVKKGEKIGKYYTVLAYAELPLRYMDAVALSVNFESMPSYIKKILKAKIEEFQGNKSFLVDYEYHFPFPLSNDAYTVKYLVTQMSETQYQASWKLQKAKRSKNYDGKVFLQAKGDKTVMSYQNFVNPGTGLASGKRVYNEVSEGFEQFFNEAKRLASREGKSNLLTNSKELEIFRKSLK
ncbi:MAG: hypothetical protein H6620_10300 [Halobacteriovoraceae bacterium]|nr:hypothetical protein [Halobacteriovoraceae bacterium]